MHKEGFHVVQIRKYSLLRSSEQPALHTASASVYDVIESDVSSPYIIVFSIDKSEI